MFAADRDAGDVMAEGNGDDGVEVDPAAAEAEATMAVVVKELVGRWLVGVWRCRWWEVATIIMCKRLVWDKIL